MHLFRTIEGCRCLFLTSFEELSDHIHRLASRSDTSTVRGGARSTSQDHPPFSRVPGTPPHLPPQGCLSGETFSGWDLFESRTGLNIAWA